MRRRKISSTFIVLFVILTEYQVYAESNIKKDLAEIGARFKIAHQATVGTMVGILYLFHLKLTHIYVKSNNKFSLPIVPIIGSQKATKRI